MTKKMTGSASANADRKKTGTAVVPAATAATKAVAKSAADEDGAGGWAGRDRPDELLVDQGDADNFLGEQLRPHLLADACREAEIPLKLRMQPGYDHGYGFVATFMEDHLRWHAERLAR